MEDLYKYIKGINDLEYIINLLDWELKLNIPKCNAKEVNKLIYDINIKLFKKKTSQKYGKLLEETLKFKKLGDVEKHHLKKLYKEYKDLKCIPLKFYKNYLNISSECSKYFEQAKKENNADIVLPYLEKIVKETIKMYHFRNASNIYEAMLNDYEEGVTVREIDKLFNEIKKFVIPVIKKHKKEKLSTEKIQVKEGDFHDAAIMLLSYMGFDFNKGDVGIYTNAFTSRLGFKDVRITFNMSDNPWIYASTVVHEGGHGLVESNIGDENLKYASNSLKSLTALHESQSRFFENILSKNENFWTPIYSKYKKILKLNIDKDLFVKNLSTISPGLIRLEADELSYCLHIIIRYEIEKDLFSGKIRVYDIPNMWNKKVYEYLGLNVIDDNNGFLQDVHWSQGSFGYFPSYLLGNIYSAMFMDVVEKELGSIDEILKNNKIKTIVEFFKDNIYKYGGAYSAKEIFKKMGYKKISTNFLIKYFKIKYNIK